MKRILFALLQVSVFVLAIGIPYGRVAAQSGRRPEWETQVRRQLRVNASQLADYDIVPTHEVYVDTLNSGYYKDVDYNLDAGVRYIFVGACDNDCSDLDLRLFDDNWNLIDSDTKADDHPSLVIVVRRSTTFHLRITMSKCNANPCWWGTQAFRPADD